MTRSSSCQAAFSTVQQHGCHHQRSFAPLIRPCCVPLVEWKQQPQRQRFRDNLLWRRSSSLFLSGMKYDGLDNSVLHDCLSTSQLPNILLSSTQDNSRMEDVVATTAVSFEPQLNLPAFGSFVFIFIVFSVLRFRINGINDAAERRKDALKNLREIKSKQLGLEASDAEAQMAIVQYQKALEEEENLRTIIPGVRIRAPNSASQSKEDMRAIQQFLGDETKEKMLGLVNNPEDDDDESKATTGAVPPPLVLFLLLVLIGGSQALLLVLLSLDTTPTLH